MQENTANGKIYSPLPPISPSADESQTSQSFKSIKFNQMSTTLDNFKLSDPKSNQKPTKPEKDASRRSPTLKLSEKSQKLEPQSVTQGTSSGHILEKGKEQLMIKGEGTVRSMTIAEGKRRSIPAEEGKGRFVPTEECKEKPSATAESIRKSIPAVTEEDKRTSMIKQEGKERFTTVGNYGSSVLFEIGRKITQLYLCEDHSCSSCVENLTYISKVKSSEIIAQRLLNLGMLELSQEIWRKFFQSSAQEAEPLSSDPEMFVMLLTSGIIINMTDASSGVCRAIIQTELYIDLIDFLKSDLVDPHSKNLSSDLNFVVENLITILYNIIQVSDDARELFREQKIVKVLQRFLTKVHESVSCVAMVMLAWVINEDENHIIDSNKNILEFLEREMQSAVRSGSSRSEEGYKTVELLAAINKIAVNDNNKVKIVESGMLTSYAKLLNPTNDVNVQLLTSQGIWSLALKCADEIRKDEACVQGLKLLLTKTDHDGVRRQAKGALEALGIKSAISSGKTRSANEKPQIFISYQHSSKDTVFKIRDRLRVKGYTVWIDADEMSGSIGEDITYGIDESSVVLTCLSQRYYESPYCRKEVIYADDSRKELIPLLMEPKYKPHGWLRFQMADRLWLDFSQPQDFEKSFANLLRRLSKTSGSVENKNKRRDGPEETQKRNDTHTELPKSINETLGKEGAESGRETPGQPSAETKTETISYSTSTTVGVYSWTKAHVKEWLERNDFHHLMKWFEDYDGRLLLEYQFVLERAPELVAPSFIAANSVRDFLRVNMALRQL